MKAAEKLLNLLSGRGIYASFMVISALSYTVILLFYIIVELIILLLGIGNNNKSNDE